MKNHVMLYNHVPV